MYVINLVPSLAKTGLFTRRVTQVMKIQNIRRAIRAGGFALAAVPFAITASAQTNTNANANYSSAPAQTSRVVERDHDTDYGWVGLLGLAGLAGLLKKPKQVVVDRTERTADTTNRARV